MLRRTLALAVLLALTGTACSSGGEGGGSDGAGDCVDLTTQGDTFTIRMEDNEFLPSCFTASAGQSIRIVNEDAGLHSFTLEGTSIDVDIAGGETFEGGPVTGEVAPGTYQLICKYHLPGMQGEVRVVG